MCLRTLVQFIDRKGFHRPAYGPIGRPGPLGILHIWSQIKQVLILECAIRFECLERLVSSRQKGGGCIRGLFDSFDGILCQRVNRYFGPAHATVQHLCLFPFASV